MTITLAQAKVGMPDKVDQNVIDEFRRSSLLLDMMEFDNIISPIGGSTLTYGYIKLKTPSTAAIRAINTEYTAGEALREEATTKAIIMGGSFELDRVIIDTAGVIDELAFQLKEKVKATTNYFHYLAINGDASESGTSEFDGLSTLLAGSSTEVTSAVDVSSSANLDSNYQALLDEIDGFMAKLARKPDLLIMNGQMLVKVRSAARRAGYYSRTEDAFGRPVDTYNNIPMMDAGKYFNGVNTVDVVATTEDGKSDIYAVCLGRDGFVGISVEGNKIVRTYIPDLNAPGAVKKGEVEFVAGVALKNTLMAGKLKGVTIAASES